MAYLSTHKAEYAVTKQTVYCVYGTVTEVSAFSLEQFAQRLSAAGVGYLHLSHWFTLERSLPSKLKHSARHIQADAKTVSEPSSHPDADQDPDKNTLSDAAKSADNGSEAFHFAAVFDATREGQTADFASLRSYLQRHQGWMRQQQASLVRVSSGGRTEPLLRCQTALSDLRLQSLAFWSVPGELCFVIKNHTADACVAVCFEAMWDIEA